MDGQGAFVELPEAHEDTLIYDYYQLGEAHLGRLKSITRDFEGTTPSQVRYIAYTDKGQVWRTWGDVTIPVEKSYDEYGQFVSFRTFRDSAAVNWSTDDIFSPGTVTSGGDETTLVYDEATGSTTIR